MSGTYESRPDFIDFISDLSVNLDSYDKGMLFDDSLDIIEEAIHGNRQIILMFIARYLHEISESLKSMNYE